MLLLNRNKTEVVRLSIVFNISIRTRVGPEIVSAPKRTGMWRKKNNKAEIINGRNIFFDSSERRLKTNPVDNICSILAAIMVDEIHIIDVDVK